jgi:methylglutaconyl-CoA hydratase
MRFYTEDDVQAFGSVRFLYLKTSLEDYVFRITLNRPEKRNAFTPTMVEEIIFALAFAHYNRQVRCVVISGEGPVFCAGADLNAFHDTSNDISNSTLPKIREEAILGDAFSELHKPSVAQVEGPVLAGGFLIICGCTFVISTPEATYSLPEVKRGIWPMQVMASLLSVVHPKKALEMAITAKVYSSHAAYQYGLVTEVVGKGEIMNSVDDLVKTICQNAPFAIQAGMRVYQELSIIPENKRHSYLKDQLAIILQTEDAKEGVTAFKEKRNADWQGK